MYLSNDDFVFPSFLLNLLIKIILERKPFLFPPPIYLFTYLIMSFYQYGLMGIYFILWVIIYYYHCLLLKLF